MTHDELLARIDKWADNALGVGALTHSQMCSSNSCDCYECDRQGESLIKALRAVVELHKPDQHNFCLGCSTDENGIHDTSYPCPTIQAIEKELG